MYQGQYYDAEIELAYNRYRYYSPDQGRYISKDPIGLLSGEANLYSYVDDPNGWVDVFGLAKTYNQKSKRWKDTETGRYTTKPTDPGQMVHNGQIKYGDIQQWASENGLSNNWQPSPNPNRFASGGYSYSDGTHTVHGHGVDSVAQSQWPSGNSANGPTTSIKNNSTGMNTRADGSSGTFNSDRDGSHIPTTNSPF